MTRTITAHKYERHTHYDTTLHIIYITWCKLPNAPRTKAIKRIHPQKGWGVLCFCAAMQYKKECYHKKLVQQYITDHRLDQATQ
jgi:hypothetical protein